MLPGISQGTVMAGSTALCASNIEIKLLKEAEKLLETFVKLDIKKHT